MSGNKLLTENTIRRFMKLANVDALTETFLDEGGMGYAPAKRGKKPHDDDAMEETVEGEETIEEEEELDEEVDALYEQDEDEDMEMDMEMGDEEDDEDMEMDMDMGDDLEAGDEIGAADMSLTEEEAQLLIDLGERLKEAMAGEEGDDDIGDMDDMEDMEDAAAEEEPAPEEEEVDQEDLVNEVLKRVTKRLVAAKLSNRK